MRGTRRPELFAVALLGATLSAGGHAFANVEVGDKLEEVQLPALGGGAKRPYLGKAGATVFVFFRVAQPFSKRAIEEIAALEKELAGKPITWVAIFSDREPLEEAKAMVKASGFGGLALVDPGDALYGKLGAALTPVAGIAGKDHRLAQYLPFQKINYGALIRAWALHTLGELSDAQLQAVLDPPKPEDTGDSLVAHRWVKYSERQIASGSFEKASESAHKALAADPNLPAAHGALGAALAGMGRCKEAAPELELALEADPQGAAALAGKRWCHGDGGTPPP